MSFSSSKFSKQSWFLFPALWRMQWLRVRHWADLWNQRDQEACWLAPIRCRRSRTQINNVSRKMVSKTKCVGLIQWTDVYQRGIESSLDDKKEILAKERFPKVGNGPQWSFENIFENIKMCFSEKYYLFPDNNHHWPKVSFRDDLEDPNWFDFTIVDPILFRTIILLHISINPHFRIRLSWKNAPPFQFHLILMFVCIFPKKIYQN